ncbi:hypothetical protein [Congregibacter sp.]|uniref:hypothetical protein n=1 Tax=Congregibacter sp. TaxID=2744308 RepID=UPI00385D4EEB
MGIHKVVTLYVVLLFSAEVFAQSDGCSVKNGITTPASAANVLDIPRSYLAGETISATAASPGSTSNLTITVDSGVVATAAFPGTVSYTVPTSGTFTIEIRTDPSSSVTFTSIACTVPSVSVPASPAWSLALVILAMFLLALVSLRAKGAWVK